MDRRREQVDEHQKAGGFSPARFEIERGPVRVIVEASPAKARLSDQITLTLRIEAAAGVQVRKPNLKGSIGDFVIRDFRQPLPRVDEDREIFERVYALEPTKTGTLSIPPLRIAFTDPRGQNGEAESVLETEPFRIEIESVVASETPSLADLRPLAPPVPVPAQRTPSLWWSLVPLGAVLAAVVWLIRRRQRRMVEAAPLSPRELARDELERLLGRDLADDHYRYKLEWLARLRRGLDGVDPSEPLVIGGDFNIAPTDDDVWDPAAFEGATHVSPPEREALGGLLDWGLVDTFRRLHGEPGLFSWWDYRAGNFHKRKGMRIDLLLATAPLADAATFALIDRQARKGTQPSDHAPVLADFDHP